MDFQKDPSGKFWRSYSVQTYRCPSSNSPTHHPDGNGWAVVSYAASIGHQAMPSLGGMCNAYPGNTFPGNYGWAGHGNEYNRLGISGPFSRLYWAADLSDIKDGTANVILMGEILAHKSDHSMTYGWLNGNTAWFATTAPINFPIRGVGEPGHPGPNDCSHFQNWQTSQGFKSDHTGGAQFLFADGSTHFIQQNIDYMTYQRLGDRRDGNPVGSY